MSHITSHHMLLLFDVSILYTVVKVASPVLSMVLFRSGPVCSILLYNIASHFSIELIDDIFTSSLVGSSPLQDQEDIYIYILSLTQDEEAK